MKNNTFFSLLILVIIIGTLINNNVFVTQSLYPLFAYFFTVSTLLFIVGITFFKKDNNTTVFISWPLLIFILWICYVIINGCFINKGIGYHQSYLICNCLFFIASYILFRRYNEFAVQVYKIISVLSIIESFVCAFQFFGLTKSYNHYFTVTGTWQNPNVTAMFLAITIPSILIMTFKEKGIIKKFYILGIVIIVAALVMLKCRTALVGAIVSSVILFNYQYSIYEWLKSKLNIYAKIGLLVSSIVIIGVVSFYAYEAKKASADGRKLVWKVTLNMIAHKPLTGYGYGSFEKNYNLNQANYFENGNGTVAEKENAGHVKMAYNEFLENSEEGGIIGLMFFMGFLVLILLYPIIKKAKNQQPEKLDKKTSSIPYKHEKILFVGAYSAIVAFAIMSLLNFTIQALPMMCVLMLYISLLSTDDCYFIQIEFLKGVNYKFKRIKGYSTLLISVCFFSFEYAQACAHLELKQAVRFEKKRKYDLALELLEPLRGVLCNSESYWSNYAYILIYKNQYHLAIEKLIKAKEYSSNPDLFLQTGFCYENTGSFKNAEKEYSIAKNIEPSHIEPRYSLMRMYIKMKDSLNAINTAKEIVLMKPKVVNDKAIYYQRSALQVVKSYSLASNHLITTHPNEND